MKSFEQGVKLFFGMFLMLAFSCASYRLLGQVSDILVISKAGAQMIVYLKTLSSPVIIIAGLLLAIATWGKGVDKAFKVLYPLNIFIISAFAWLLHINSFLLDNLYIVGGFYLWTKIFIILSPALIWGFANQEYTFRTAAIQYPILGLLAMKMFPLGSLLFINIDRDADQVAVVALLSLLVYLVYHWMTRSDSGEREKGASASWVYWAALAALVFGIKFLTFFPEIVFKAKVGEVFARPNDFMQSFCLIRTGLGFFVGLIGVFFGGILYFRGRKSLANIANFFIFAMEIVGIILFYMFLSVTFTEDLFTSTAMGYALFVGLAGVFGLFKELLFFRLEPRIRFSAKVVVDVIVYAVAAFIVTLTSAGLLSFYGSLNECTNLFFVLFLVGSMLCTYGYAGIYIDSKRESLA